MARVLLRDANVDEVSKNNLIFQTITTDKDYRATSL